MAVPNVLLLLEQETGGSTNKKQDTLTYLMFSD
jgi:hypothetical protein